MHRLLQPFSILASYDGCKFASFRAYIQLDGGRQLTFDSQGTNPLKSHKNGKHESNG